MNFFFKVFGFVYGILLSLFCIRRLNFNRLAKDKRIAIVGAASSAYGTGKGEYIDGFDIVIRINKAPLLLKDGKWKTDIGSKADILFHSFFENEKSGGGSLDLVLFDQLGIQYIVNPIPVYDGLRVTFNFYKKYKTPRITYTLSCGPYRVIQRGLGNYRPTIGFCALMTSLESDFSELYITGFTFFKTAFGEGYRDSMKEATQVQQYLKDAGLHNPDREFEQFLQVLAANKNKKISMDETLQSIVKAHTAN